MSVLTRIVRFASASTPSFAMGGERASVGRLGKDRSPGGKPPFHCEPEIRFTALRDGLLRLR